MNVLLNSITFAIAFAASVACALLGLGKVFGPDIGFAGGGLWYLMVPAAVLGLLGASLIVYFLKWPPNLHLRRLGFIGLAAAFSAAVAPAGLKVIFFAITPPDPEFVYVPAPTYSATIEITMPAEATKGEPVMVKAVYRGGPWERVRYQDLTLERYRDVALAKRTEAPPAIQTDAGEWLGWSTDPPSGGVHRGRGDGSAGGFPMTFNTTGPYKVWFFTENPMKVTSNVATITVYAK